MKDIERTGMHGNAREWCDTDESAGRCVRANKNKCKCAGVSDHLELSTNTMIDVVQALELSVRSVR